MNLHLESTKSLKDKSIFIFHFRTSEVSWVKGLKIRLNFTNNYFGSFYLFVRNNQIFEV